MAQLTVPNPRTFDLTADVSRIDFPQAAEKTFEGSALGDKSGLGNVRQLVAGDKFIGFADIAGYQDNSAGTDGSMTIPIIDKCNVWLNVASASTMPIGSKVFASDGNTFTVASAAGANSQIGCIRQKTAGSSTYCSVSAAGVGRRAG
ncbi:MAG: hypothetical protein ACLPL5_12260 [Stellaceae bacterium]